MTAFLLGIGIVGAIVIVALIIIFGLFMYGVTRMSRAHGTDWDERTFK